MNMLYQKFNALSDSDHRPIPHDEYAIFWLARVVDNHTKVGPISLHYHFMG